MPSTTARVALGRQLQATTLRVARLVRLVGMEERSRRGRWRNQRAASGCSCRRGLAAAVRAGRRVCRESGPGEPVLSAPRVLALLLLSLLQQAVDVLLQHLQVGDDGGRGG